MPQFPQQWNFLFALLIWKTDREKQLILQASGLLLTCPPLQAWTRLNPRGWNSIPVTHIWGRTWLELSHATAQGVPQKESGTGRRGSTHTQDAPGAVLTTTIIINFPGIRHADGKQQTSQNSSAQPVPISPTPASSVNPSYSLLPLLLFLALSILNIEMCKPHLSFNPLYALTV